MMELAPAPVGTKCEAPLCGDAAGPFVLLELRGERIGFVCEPCEQAFMVDIAKTYADDFGEAEAVEGLALWFTTRNQRPPPFNLRRWPARREV